MSGDVTFRVKVQDNSVDSGFSCYGFIYNSYGTLQGTSNEMTTPDSGTGTYYEYANATASSHGAYSVSCLIPPNLSTLYSARVY